MSGRRGHSTSKMDPAYSYPVRIVIYIVKYTFRSNNSVHMTKLWAWVFAWVHVASLATCTQGISRIYSLMNSKFYLSICLNPWQSSRSIYSEYIEIGFSEFIKVVEIGIHKTDFMNLIFRVRAELLSIYSYTHNLLDWRILWIRVEVYTWKSWPYTRQIGLAFFNETPLVQ